GSLEIKFPDQYKNIEFIHNGASTQEWLVKETYKINSKELHLMKIVHTDSDRWFIVFPVDEDQSLGVLNYISNQQLGLSMLATIKDKDQPQLTHSYFVEAYIQSK
ncbi:MAG TPA: hypothetical protein PLJ21_13860, partial [Pseudobdellovibrionaceae bacterium]|nr:hypothetical protein [Pseudobdellovibrionaceae bacterium]